MSSELPERDVSTPAEAVGPRLACELPIERDGVFVHNELVLSGWALSPVGIGGVIVQIDDRLLHASYGLDTPWLAKSAPDIEGSDRGGYRLVVDTSDWEPGRRQITIAAYDQNGRRGEMTGAIDVVPFREPRYTSADNLAAIADGEIAMWLERPAPFADPAPEVESPVEIAGWAYAEGGVEAVLVTIDGQTRVEALHPVFRPDLVEDYGDDIARQAGFVLRLDPRECPPGWHRLSVVALDYQQRAVGFETEFVALPEPEPVETPPPGEAMPVEWIPEPRPDPPRLREPDASATPWEDRALLAEAHAAASRNESNTARLHQEATLRELRQAERDVTDLGQALDEARAEFIRARTALTQTQADLDERTAELAARTTERDDRAAQVSEQSTELARQAGQIEQLTTQLAGTDRRLAATEASISWRITRPLRAIKRGVSRLRRG